MKVSRLPVDTGPAGWNAILPPWDPNPELAEAITADWLIIGAGFAGLSAARRLTQLCPGDRIALLEATRIAEGPVGRNSGFMIDLPHHLSSDNYAGADAGQEAQQIALNREAIAFARSAAEEYGFAADVVDQCGKVNAAATPKGVEHNQVYAEHLAGLGEDHTLLDAAAMRELTGSDYYLGGLYTPGTAMLQPAAYARGLAAGLSARVEIYESSPVLEVESVAGGHRAQTPLGSVEAPRVILATNGHAESFGFFKRRLVHVHLFASMTRVLTTEEIALVGGDRKWGLTPSDPAGTTVRRISSAAGDRIVVRNRIAYSPSLETSPQRVQAFGRDQDRAFAARFPALNGMDMEYRWGGRLCLSMNEVPAFGEVEEGIFAACCQNGLGAAQGTISGILAAEQASGQASDRLEALTAGPEPKRLPPEPLARIGATASIRWKEFRAGREI
ncbi:MAG: FAD-binding oxidoreductase [Pseudomonadota bacterium]